MSRGAVKPKLARKRWRTEVRCDRCQRVQVNAKAAAAKVMPGVGRHPRACTEMSFPTLTTYVAPCVCGSTTATYAHA